MLTFNEILKVNKFELQYGCSEGCFSPRFHQDVAEGRMRTAEECRQVCTHSKNESEEMSPLFKVEQANEDLMINSIPRKPEQERIEVR